VGAAQEMLSGLLAAARLSVPDDVAELLAGKGRDLGADGVSIYLVDYDQRLLVPLPQTAGARDPLPIDSTLAGRCFRELELQHSHAGDGLSVWAPILDGLERLGVVAFDFHDAAVTRATDDELHAFAALVAELVLTKSAYGDLFHVVRRREPMSLAAEIAWRLLPPLTFGTERVVISAVLAPAYDVGGDSFDYSADSATAQFGVFDAMGHGLSAGLLASVAIGAYRNARRNGADLLDIAHAIDAAISGQFGGDQFVTGVLVELDLATGAMVWHSAGHPAPLLLRAGHVVKSLEAESCLPFGLGAARTSAAERLEPGDRVLPFTDGVTEARSVGGELFGVDRFAELVAREDSAGRPAPETMRRLMHAILAHSPDGMRDDATAMLVEWRGAGGKRIAP
jgi:serine phosphatase RsbU (regulator of sigma subunit)